MPRPSPSGAPAVDTDWAPASAAGEWAVPGAGPSPEPQRAADVEPSPVERKELALVGAGGRNAADGAPTDADTPF
ncbi:hypothetical protein [Microbacterium sp. 4R-513]|uniref:hypothetical protein n=1 Tax=Microbacterium sp. 4R-513 TaxID=2567934 RepID=UPI001F493640|nr:hypothetical protein [Microbacterium sp. 4R-513]